jgi:hypothetical protein
MGDNNGYADKLVINGWIYSCAIKRRFCVYSLEKVLNFCQDGYFFAITNVEPAQEQFRDSGEIKTFISTGDK